MILYMNIAACKRMYLTCQESYPYFGAFLTPNLLIVKRTTIPRYSCLIDLICNSNIGTP